MLVLYAFDQSDLFPYFFQGANHGPGSNFSYEMVENENEKMVDHLSTKVQALKSVSLVNIWIWGIYQLVWITFKFYISLAAY